MTTPRYLTFPQIARMAASQPASPFSPEDMRNALHQDFFGARLSAAAMRTMIRHEDGGEDSTGQRRGVSYGHSGSPIGVQTVWSETSPDAIRDILRTNNWSPLAPDADLGRYGRVPLNDWPPNARQYLLDNLALTVKDATRWCQEMAPTAPVTVDQVTGAQPKQPKVEPTITFLDLARAIGADPAHERTIQSNLKLLYSDALSGAFPPGSLSWNAHSHCNRRDSEGYLLEAVQTDGRLDFAPERARLTPHKIIEILADDFRWPLAVRARDLLALGKDADACRLVAEGPVPDEARARLFVESLAIALSEAHRFCERNSLPVPGRLMVSRPIGATMVSLPERAWLSLTQAVELVSRLASVPEEKALEAVVGAGIDGRIVSQGIGTYGSIVDPRLHQLRPHEWRADASLWRQNEIGEAREIEVERRSIYAWLGIPMLATHRQSAETAGASGATDGYLPAWLPPERALDLVTDLQRGPGPSDVHQLVFQIRSAVFDGAVRARRDGDGKMLSPGQVRGLAERTEHWRRWRGQLPEGIELCAEDIRRTWSSVAAKDTAPTEAGTDARPEIDDTPRSGGPGRPSSMHLVAAEFGRRMAAGEVSETLQSEGDALAQWLQTNYPQMPRATSKTIRNNIRTEFNCYKARVPPLKAKPAK